MVASDCVPDGKGGRLLVEGLSGWLGCERHKVVGKRRRRTETYEEKPGGEETGMSWEKECHYGLVLRGERLGDLAANLSQLGGIPCRGIDCLNDT